MPSTPSTEKHREEEVREMPTQASAHGEVSSSASQASESNSPAPPSGNADKKQAFFTPARVRQMVRVDSGPKLPAHRCSRGPAPQFPPNDEMIAQEQQRQAALLTGGEPSSPKPDQQASAMPSAAEPNSAETAALAQLFGKEYRYSAYLSDEAESKSESMVLTYSYGWDGSVNFRLSLPPGVQLTPEQEKKVDEGTIKMLAREKQRRADLLAGREPSSPKPDQQVTVPGRFFAEKQERQRAVDTQPDDAIAQATQQRLSK